MLLCLESEPHSHKHCSNAEESLQNRACSLVFDLYSGVTA